MGVLLCTLLCCTLHAADGFISLMPKRDIAEHWTVEGKTPPDAWIMLRDGTIETTGQRQFPSKQKEVPQLPPESGVPIPGKVGAETGSAPVGERGLVHPCPADQRWLAGAQRRPFVTDRPEFGSWDKYEITSKYGRITILVNGVAVNEGTGAWPEEGNVCLQSGCWPCSYRNVSIKELK